MQERPDVGVADERVPHGGTSGADKMPRTPIAHPLRPWVHWSMAAAAAAIAVQAQEGPRTIWDGVFSAEQAARGRQRYEVSCAYCHRDDLSGGGGDEPGAAPPALTGDDFLAAWANLDVASLIGLTSTTMPYQRPKLDPNTYRDIVSYLLQANGAPAGRAELPTEMDELKRIVIVPKPAR